MMTTMMTTTTKRKQQEKNRIRYEFKTHRHNATPQKTITLIGSNMSCAIRKIETISTRMIGI